MDNPSELSTSFLKANYVQEIESVVGRLSGSPQAQAVASAMFYELIETDLLHKLHGSADEWFNLSTSAARVRNYTACERILSAGIEQHPEDVDLRCSRFSFCYGHRTIEDALAARAELEAMGQEKTATFWRYWCYNAIFESQHLGNREAGAQLLDRALAVVPSAGLLNVFRQYRFVLIDGRANPSHAEPKQSTDHAERVQRVEDKFREGLSLGLEAGYVLAVDLAKLLRERSSGKESAEADEVLDEVLDLFDAAERTYTEDGNHPLWEIYGEKAITLVARRRYEDALQIFRSLPEYRLSDSMRVMAQYAANMTGQEFRPAGEQPAQSAYDELTQRVTRLERLTAPLEAILNRSEEASQEDGR